MKSRFGWILPLGVFVWVFGFQLWLVAVAGTDIPFHDQWNIEGQWLYPAFQDGTLKGAKLLGAFNEHRIFWTHGLNLALFTTNGQWDPLVQLVAIAVLRALCAVGVFWYLATDYFWRGGLALAAGVAVAFLPHLAWHTVLWGIQSHTYFVFGFSALALALLGTGSQCPRRIAAGFSSGIAALFAMGPSALVPFALIGLAGIRMVERRTFSREIRTTIWPALLVLGIAVSLRGQVPEHASLRVADAGAFILAAAKIFSWPHSGNPGVALIMNFPLVVLVGARICRQRTPLPGEDFVLLLGFWSAAIALGTAWVRGGSVEFAGGLPSRYVDFIVMLPFANAWCALALVGDLTARWRRSARIISGAWLAFFLVGWVGLSAQVMKGLVLPRARDREAPTRLVLAYQQTWDEAVFAGQPRLLVPYPHLPVVREVLTDARLRTKLPPSLQPDVRPGPLSRLTRAVLTTLRRDQKEP